jgi:AcrR family transcriptional regulator
VARTRSEEARRAALAAAIELMAAEGVEGLTIEDVAARSGVAKTTIYRHWPSRRELIIDGIRSCWPHLSTPDTGDLRTDLRELFDHMARKDLSSTMGRIMPSLTAAASRDPELEQVARELIEDRNRPVRQLLAQAQQRGELPADLDVEVALGLVIGPLLYRKVHRRLPLTKDFLARSLDASVRALCAPPTDGPSPRQPTRAAHTA